MRRRSKGIQDLYTSRVRDATQKRLWCVRIKIISMGALGVGKSCLIKRFCEERVTNQWLDYWHNNETILRRICCVWVSGRRDRTHLDLHIIEFVSKYISTIGIDYGVKPVTVDGASVRINFWDMSGHPDFFEIRNEFYKDSQGALLVYDVANRASFDELEEWLVEAANFGAGGIPTVVFANKVDRRRVVTREEGLKWAHDHGFEYIETSASSGASVTAGFRRLFEMALANMRTKAKSGNEKVKASAN